VCDRFTLSLSVSAGHPSGFGAQWTLDGTLDVTGASIDGSVHASGTTADRGQTCDTTLDFREVVLGDTGCAVGGSVYATSSASADPDTRASGHDIDGTFVFGPGC
jgi:hypothetical protein